MPARSRLSRFLFGPPFLVLLALFGCETTEVSRSDSQLHIFAGRDYTSTDLQLRLKPREGILTMQDGENFVGDNAAITTALMLDPGGIATVFAFPLPDDRISVEAMAVGFGRMLQNGFA
jgi:hypothetical protein